VQPGTTEWPEYTYEGRRVIVFENTTQVTTQTGLRDRYCDFWWYLVPELVAATATGTDFSPRVILYSGRMNFFQRAG